MSSKPSVTINLSNLVEVKKLSPGTGRAMAEAASVCFESQGHSSGVLMTVKGAYSASVDVEWDKTTDQMRRSWNDLQDATHWGAEGCALLLVEELADLRMVLRSRKGTGFDWWLGDSKDELFQKKARLEVSGILSGSDRIASRVTQKKKQTTASDATKLEAVVVVVEFSSPASHVEKRP